MINGVMLQTFEWETNGDGQFYNRLAERAEELATLGITAVWMPPACKGVSEFDVGYGSYDYFDIGEFDQKGTIRTKYGTREELEACIKALKAYNINVYADMVYNHKGGADKKELFKALKVNPDNRSEEISEPYDIEGWTHFTFEGRNKKYSDFEWHYYHFNGVDYDDKSGESGIYKIIGENKDWDSDTDNEMGNYDYLMNANIDHSHPEVRAELMKVSRFMIDTFGYDGFRYDALKHISRSFIKDHSKEILESNPNFFFVGEYWKDDIEMLDYFLDETEHLVTLFDVPLHFRMYQASKNGEFDLRTIFDNTLVQRYPQNAVTFVDNHDSQPSQSLDSWVEPWFKEIAYSLILFREAGFPCVFSGDYEGLNDNEYEGIGEVLKNMISIRRDYNFGEQVDYFETADMIGWTRLGNEEHPGKLAVLISTGEANQLKMHVGADQAGRVYCDRSGKNEDITIDENGDGLFTVAPGAVTYWTEKL